MKLFIVIIALLFLGFESLLVHAAPNERSYNQIEIRVLPESVVYKEQYQLGDIAELDGFDIDFVKKLSQVNIGRSPMPGHSHRISKGQITSHLRGLLSPDRFMLILPKSALVSRASMKLAKDQLRKMIIQGIKKSYAKYKQINIRLQTRLREQFLPTGKLTFQLNRIGTSAKIGGYGSWSVRLVVDHHLYKKLIIRAKVEVIDQVVVAKGLIPKGTIIMPKNLKTISKVISNEPIDYARGTSLIIGQQAKRDINQNESIKTHLVGQPILLEKGQPVLLVYETKSIYLSNMAIALRDGKKGDVIPVRIIGHKKTIYAVVIDSKRVEVAL